MFTYNTLLSCNWAVVILQIYSSCFPKGFVTGSDSHPNKILRRFNTLTFSKALPMKPATDQYCSYPAAFPFESSLPDLLRVSAGPDLFQNSFGCGLCVQIDEKFTDPAGKTLVLTKTAIVVDYCRDCGPADSLGYSFESSGDIVYKAIHCPTEEVVRRDIQLRLVKPSVRQLKIQILNARIPTASIEVGYGGHIRCLEHSKDNFFVLEDIKEIPSSFMLGITSIAGETLWQTIHVDEIETKNYWGELIDLGVQFIGISAELASSTLKCFEGLTQKKMEIPESILETANARWTIRYPSASKGYPEIPLLNFAVYQSPSYRLSVHSFDHFTPNKEWLYLQLKLTNGNSKSEIMVESCEKQSVSTARNLTRIRFISNSCPAVGEASFLNAGQRNVKRLKVKTKWLLPDSHSVVIRCTVIYCPIGSRDPNCQPKCQDRQDFKRPNSKNSYSQRKRRSENQGNITSASSSNALFSTAAVKVLTTEHTRKASSYVSDVNYIVWFVVATIAAVIFGILFKLWRKKVAFRSVTPQCMPGNGRQVDYIVKRPALTSNFTKI